MAPRKHRTTRPPAPKPSTLDDYLATRERINRAGAEFLKLDVETALTFLLTARQSADESRRQRNRRAARRAYDTVVRLIERLKLSDEDRRTLALGLEQIRSELKSFGEVL